MQLKRRGIATDVVFSADLIGNSGTSYVLDTESRGMSGEEAYSTVRKIIKDIDFSGFKYVIKKVDSTLRGNIAEEIKAVDEAFKSDLVVFSPALPDLGRTTVEGVHCLNGIPITKTELAKDPIKPVTQDNIKKILEKVYDEKITHVSIKDLQEDNFNFSAGRIFTFDASSNAHMQIIIKNCLGTGKRILWVGTAAMADNLFEIEYRTPPSLAVVGSVSSVTRSQVKFAENSGIKILKVPVSDIIEGKNINNTVDEAVEILSHGNDLIIISPSSYSLEEYELINTSGAGKSMTTNEISIFVQDLLGKISKEVLEKIRVSGVFLTGGDTAIGLFKKLGALGSSISGEVTTGIPLMRLRGGSFDGLKVITKAGAFGKEDILVYSMRKLKEVTDGQN